MDKTVEPSEITFPTAKTLLEAGVHFGHRTRFWNPKMQPFIYGKREGIYIIDVEKTLERLRIAYDFIRRVAEQGQDILFVGTKQQAKPIIEEEAIRCGALFVNERWVGGLLTNFNVVSLRITRYLELEKLVQEGELEKYPTKEATRLMKEYNRLKKVFHGLRNMEKLPGALYVIDPRREETPVREARRVKIPIVGFVDTNADPTMVDYPIPGNDDAMRSIKLITSVIANAVLEGKKILEQEIEEV
jgi:small subunit ribosomal protein S2